MSTKQQRLDAEVMGIPVKALSGCSQESPMPQSINEQYDDHMLNYHDLNQLVHKLNRFNVEKQAKLDEIRRVCGTRNHPGVNISVHALANTILRIIGG